MIGKPGGYQRSEHLLDCDVDFGHKIDRALLVDLDVLPEARHLQVIGANDGLVPMSSQYWGETLAEIEADHFAQIGWQITAKTTFDALGLYAFVVARLGDVATRAA